MSALIAGIKSSPAFKMKVIANADWISMSLIMLNTLLIQDHVLEAWISAIRTRRIQHCSLHYAGVRLDAARLGGGSSESVKACCDEFQDSIYAVTGYEVKIVEKKHEYFLEQLRGGTATGDADTSVPAKLRTDGNCIPLAICMLQKTADVIGNRIDIPDAAKARSYRECQSLCSVMLSPIFCVSSLSPGQWLLHSELLGRPHCIGVRVGVDGNCMLYDSCFTYSMSLQALHEIVQSSIDAQLIVAFRVEQAEAPLSQTDGTASTLLDLRAGSGGIFECDICDLIEDDLSDGTASEPDTPEDEAAVFVDARLHECLAKEVRAAVAAVSQLKYSKLQHCDRIRCMLCPFRAFVASKTHYKQRLLDHTSSYHNDQKLKGGMPFVASGSKQAKLIRALYDHDRTLGRIVGSYLQRSSTILRGTVQPPLSDSVNAIDKQISLVLDADGPRFANHTTIAGSSNCRRIGHTYCTKAFSEKLLRESLLQHGRLRTIRSSLIGECSRDGNEAVAMFPVNTRTWMALLADVMESPMVLTLLQQLMVECVQHEEFKHISMDATLRCAMRIRGQASYRAAARVRADAPITDEDAMRRVLTMRGRTGAPMCMTLVKSEAASDIRMWMKTSLEADVLNQIETVASDAPSGIMFEELKNVCKNLYALSLDPVHLVIVYHQAFWRKRTPGQTLLRRLQAKFNKVSYDRDVCHWGSIYTG